MSLTDFIGCYLLVYFLTLVANIIRLVLDVLIVHSKQDWSNCSSIREKLP